jgi:hypothetical protein
MNGISREAGKIPRPAREDDALAFCYVMLNIINHGRDLGGAAFLVTGLPSRTLVVPAWRLFRCVCCIKETRPRCDFQAP